jgi:hypothetical protein
VGSLTSHRPTGLDGLLRELMRLSSQIEIMFMYGELEDSERDTSLFYDKKCVPNTHHDPDMPRRRLMYHIILDLNPSSAAT